MMMPANYSAIAETEMTYVVGGDSLFPAFNPLSTLFTNVVNIIGNTFVPKLVDATIGTIFGGNYHFGDVFNGIGTSLKNRYNGVMGTTLAEDDNKVTGGFNGVLNAGAAVVGGMAAVAQLMNNDVKVFTKEKLFGVDGVVIG